MIRLLVEIVAMLATWYAGGLAAAFVIAHWMSGRDL